MDESSRSSRVFNTVHRTLDPSGNRDRSLEHQAMERLLRVRVPIAELDSPTRHPPPRCHEGTRTSLIENIAAKLREADRTCDIVWLSGPAKVGKTAVAQTISEHAEELGVLGAAFFFSRAHHQYGVQHVISSLSYQLAVRHTEYRHGITPMLSNNPYALEGSAYTLLKNLIVQPLSVMRTRRLLMILDGLDEWQKERNQIGLLELINDLMVPSVPLLWIICTRPEAHIQQFFHGRAITTIGWRRKRLLIEDSKAQGDVRRYIRDRLDTIKAHRALEWANLDETWLHEEDVEKIARAASGHFGYASAITDFIDDPAAADPASQLQSVIASIDSTSVPSAGENPLHLLDRPLIEALSILHHDDLQVIMPLIGICALYPPLPPMHMAFLLQLDLKKCYAILHRLSSIIDVPEPNEAFKKPLRFFHSWFVDFLMDPSRSQQFTMDRGYIHLKVATQGLKVLGRTRILYARDLEQGLQTQPSAPPGLLIADRIFEFAAANVWSACVGSKGSWEEYRTLLDLISKLDFRSLCFAESDILSSQFGPFVKWLGDKIREYYNLDIIVLAGQSVVWAGDHPEVIPSLLARNRDWNPISDAHYVQISGKSSTAIIFLDHDHIIIVYQY